MYSKRANRIQSIEQLLMSNPGGFTAAELSERFGVTERMIYMDVSHLKANGSPVVGIPGPGGGISRSNDGVVASKGSHDAVEIYGYADERQRLSEMLFSASDGATSTAMVLGEMGAGKSIVTRDLMQQAERTGFSVLVGHSLERSDAPPYWPWASIFESASTLSVPRTAAAQFARSIKILEQTFTIGTQSRRVRSRLRDELTRRDHLQIHEAARLVLEMAALTRPIMIVVEDIHWADKNSLEFAHHLKIGRAHV